MGSLAITALVLALIGAGGALLVWALRVTPVATPIEEVDDPHALVEMAHERLERGERDGALELFLRAAELHEQHGNRLEAVDIYKAVLRELPDEVSVTERITAIEQHLKR